MVYKQDHLSIPLEIMATSSELSELSLSPRSTCATLEGHGSPSQEQLLHIAQGLAGAVQKNAEITQSNNEQLEVLQQQADDLAKHGANAAHLEETYEHWKMDNDKRLADWDQEEQGPEGYEENKGFISNFFIPVTDSDHTIHVLAPYIKHNGLYCLGTAMISRPVYRHKLFTPQCIMVNEEGEFPCWFFESLSSDSTYTAKVNYLQTQKDWGITAKFQWYHDTHNNITTLVAEHWSLATTIEALQQQLGQSQWCLLSSHAYKQYQLFHALQKGPYINPKSKGKGKFTSIPNSSCHGTAWF